jgi:DivIVA domain-containing protein
MADGLTPGEIRARKFGSSRRGYDRGDVSDFLDKVAGRIESLEGELSSIVSRLNQVGITDLPLLKDEIEDVGVEVQSVLDAAMAAAEGLRTRATADAVDLLAEADRASQDLRGDAWATGTDLLRQADSTASRFVAEAREDALFIRAEAEQEAKRLVTDARKQADDMVRSSRGEGERIIVIAKAESEAILEGARQSAEKAQERARALENRRTELLGELEAAEASIRDVESTGTENDTTAGAGVRVIASGDEERTYWPENEGAVRILPSTPVAPAMPESVDADAMAAEVEQMRTSVTMPESAEVDTPKQPEPSPEPAPADAKIVPETSDPEPEDAPQEREEGEAVTEVVPPDPAVEVPSAAEPESLAEPEPAAEPESLAAPAPPTEPKAPVEGEHRDKVTVVRDAPGIDALFAKLRQSPEAEAAPVEVAAVAEEVLEELPQPPVLHIVPTVEAAGDFDRRDRMLLPIENRGLRGLKRRIVELQNRVLEELRTSSGEWRLGRELVIQTMGDELDAVLLDSFSAGHAAAAEAVGSTEPQMTGGPQQGAAEVFTADLHRDVSSAIERASDGGVRRLSAEVGRVFRSWRTDEAERHVRQAARRAFNDGLLAGYKRLGVEAVELAAPGRPCGECGAGTGITWAPGGELPKGVVVPPAGDACTAIVVPVEANDSATPVGQ